MAEQTYQEPLTIDWSAMSDDQLRQVMTDVRTLLNERHDAEVNQDLSRHIGRAYLTKNCYSCPQTEKDYWPLLLLPQKVENGMLTGLLLQHTADEKTQFEYSTMHIPADAEELSPQPVSEFCARMLDIIEMRMASWFSCSVHSMAQRRSEKVREAVNRATHSSDHNLSAICQSDSGGSEGV